VPAEDNSATEMVPIREPEVRQEPLQKDTPRPARKILWVAKEGGSNQAAFAFVLAGYGDGWAVIELGRGMAPNQTLLALQPPDDEEVFAGVSTPRELAALYVRSLRARLPEGPYFLGGYSAGALLALEMARHLQEQGQEVGLLVLFDPLFVRYSRLEQFSYGALKRVLQMIEPYVQRTRFNLFRILTAMVHDQGLERHFRVLENYEPEPYAGRIAIIEAKWSCFLRPPRFVAAWKRIARGGLTRHHAQGDHHSFLRPPHARELGKKLSACLEELIRSRDG